MRIPAATPVHLARFAIAAVLGGAALVACSDQLPPSALRDPSALPGSVNTLQAFDCTGSIGGTVECKPARGGLGGASGVLIGGQNSNVKLTSSNSSYNSGTEIFQFDVTVQNLLDQSPVLRDMVAKNEIKVVGAMLDVKTGEVQFY